MTTLENNLTEKELLQNILSTLNDLPGRLFTGNILTQPDFRLSPLSRNELKKAMRIQIAKKFQQKYC